MPLFKGEILFSSIENKNTRRQASLFPQHFAAFRNRFSRYPTGHPNCISTASKREVREESNNACLLRFRFGEVLRKDNSHCEANKGKCCGGVGGSRVVLAGMVVFLD